MNLELIKSRIVGPVYPIITAFTENGDIDYKAVEKYIEFLCTNGAKVIYVMAHSSRLGLMSSDEIIQLNETVCKKAKTFDDVLVIAATPMYRSTKECKYVAQCAATSGADLISVIFSERYYTDKQVFEFFNSIAISISCGVLIHEEQFNTVHGSNKMKWSLSLLKQVIEIDNIIAIKEDAKDDEYTNEIVNELCEKVSIIVSGGSKEQFIKFAPTGCQAYLVGVGSFDPKIAVDFYSFYLDGKFEECWDIINNVEKPFFEVSKKLGWHIGIKSAMQCMDIMERFERRPLMELDTIQHEKINDILKKLKYV